MMHTDCSVTRNRFVALMIVPVLVVACCQSSASCQDTLVIRSPKTDKVSKRRGLITEWKDTTITLDSNGRVKDFDSSTVIRVETSWPDSYQQGKELLASRKYADAIGVLRTARNAESRPWAQRMISAKLIECYLATSNEAAAVGEFLTIVRDDPQTRFFSLIPLPWTDSVEPGGFAEQAKRLMKSDQLVEQLIGAAWLVTSPQRAEALEKLGVLSRDINPTIVALATAQRWRAERVMAGPREIQRWNRQIKSMPIELRAGAYLTLADAQSRNGQPQQAAINLMRIPILYPEQHGIAAAALYRCALLRHDAGQPSEAKTLLSEIRLEFPGTAWAARAKSKLNELEN